MFVFSKFSYRQKSPEEIHRVYRLLFNSGTGGKGAGNKAVSFLNNLLLIVSYSFRLFLEERLLSQISTAHLSLTARLSQFFPLGLWQEFKRPALTEFLPQLWPLATPHKMWGSGDSGQGLGLAPKRSLTQCDV